MDHVKALGIKFIVIAIVLFSILAIFNNASLTNILIISILVTGVSYLIGDLFILRRYGNLIATVADFGLAFISVWLLSTLFFQVEYGIFSASLFIAFFISISEAIFHMYMQRIVFKQDKEIYINRRVLSNNFQTEFSEEKLDRDIIELRDDKKDDN
ncbi:DUF2512 family protein [Aquibacillus halophilus]|uniref:DUF2512 family protein n=1 Tax=Aquibacillus halophilus TaxID=930132 RepID=A0A6A8DHH3_9BACI|nr:YndM family protein [Aquibacillus halophilus]MRH44680.1 DUF2512 family protein [Aquibacillus halophilus]